MADSRETAGSEMAERERVASSKRGKREKREGRERAIRR